MATTYRTRDGDVLDALCWLHYGTTVGTVEAVLEGNRGLADQGAIYPAGILITFPDLAASATAPLTRPVRLWD